MKRIWTCRRTFVALVGIGCLTALGLLVKAPVAGSIATVCLAVCTANACQKVFQKKPKGK